LAANRAPERAQRIFKAAIGAGSTADARIDVRWGAVDANNSRRYAAELVALAPNVFLRQRFWPSPHLWQPSFLVFFISAATSSRCSAAPRRRGRSPRAQQRCSST